MTQSTQLQDIQAKLREELQSIKETVAPPSGFIIGTKGKQFTLPDGSNSPGPLTCVVLDWASENTYYSGSYNPNNLVSPDCFALGRKVAAMAPSENAPKPQSELCHDCIRNQWGSAVGGGKGKACKNTRRLLLVQSDATAESQPYILPVSPTGIKHFDKFVASLENMDLHPIQMTVDISFDQNEAYPSLRFKVREQHENLEPMWALKEEGQPLLMQEREGDKEAA
jgi:hypothetical protein